MAELTLTAGSNATTTPNVATSITGFQIVGPAASTTPVKLRSTNGTLNLSTVSGVTMSGNNSSTVNLSGTVEDLNTALATLTYRRASIGTDTLEVSLVQPTEVFFEDNGHLYQFISGSYTWSNAKTAAEGRTAYGVTGYLATITSNTENNFVYQRISGDGWLGTTDIETEKNWKWVTGPEAGTAYFQENGSGGGGNPISGRYHSWASGEPNDSSGAEDCGYMYASQSGKWNDFPCSTAQGYVVEFGGDGENLPTIVAKNISIVTADVPALTALSPANGASSVSPSVNLVMTFSKAVTKQTGNILIRKTSDDEIVATVDTSSDLVTGTASTSVTINPENNLEEGIQYYVTVPSTAFSDSSSNFFSGITNDSTWVFTIADETEPSISNIVATSTASTSASITWNTNETASTRVTYGLTTSYGKITSKTDISPRVTSHSVSLSSLLPCTTYHFQVVSDDSAANNATSTDSIFTTIGCTADTTPDSTISTSIDTEDGGTSTASSSGNSLTVTLPSNVTATSSSVVIQIKSISNNPILSLYGRPSTKPNEVGGVAFDVTAIVNGDTILDSFDSPVTITYTYTDEDVSNLEEPSLWLYHYHNDSWTTLDDCNLNTTTNTISCTTPSFSVFGLFGSGVVNIENSSTSYSGTTFFGRINNLLQNGNIALAYQLLLEYVTKLLAEESEVSENLFKTETITIAGEIDLPIRDLELGMEGEEVKSLQLFLIQEKSGPATSELARVGASGFYGRYTVEALQEYQAKVGIYPASGYFGPKTRAFISNN